MTHPTVHPAFEELLRKIGFGFPRVNYLTHIDNHRKIAYVETPKVACTSIKKFMMDQYVGGTFTLRRPGMVHDRRRSPLKQFKNLAPHKAVSILLGSEYRRFSFVRNPYSRLLSGYLDKLVTNEYERARHLPMLGFDAGGHPTLLEFLERLKGIEDAERDIHFSSQAALLMVEHVDYDFIGRFESFEADFLRLQASYFGLRHPTPSYDSFGKHHASNANDKLAQYFGAEEVALVQEIYRRDFELFGYSQDLSRASAQEPSVDVTSLRANAFRADQLTLHTGRVVAALEDAKGGAEASAISHYRAVCEDLAPETRLVFCDLVGQALPGVAWFAEEGARLEQAQGNLDLARQRWADISDRFPDTSVWRVEQPFALVRAGYRDKALIAIKKLKKPMFADAWLKGAFMEQSFHMVRELPAEHLDFALDFFDLLSRKMSLSVFLKEVRQVAETAREVVEPAAQILAGHLSRSEKAEALPFLTLLFGEGHSHRIAVSNAAYLQTVKGSFAVDALGTRVFFLDTQDIEPMRETASLFLEAIPPETPAAEFVSWVWGNTPTSFAPETTTATRKRAMQSARRKIALCLSGPMQGGALAAGYWQASELLTDHDVSVFVHSWDRLWQNPLSLKYADRFFDRDLLAALRGMLAEPGGAHAVRARYPAMAARLDASDACDAEEIRRLFGTEFVVLESAQDPAFEGFGPQRKLFHKIAACHRLACAQDTDFDVFIHTRPNLYLRRSKRRELARVLEAALAETRIFCDAGLTLCPAGPYIGNQFALGGREAMDVYAGAYEAIYGPEGDMPQFQKTNRPHVPMAINLRRNDVQVDAMLQPLTKVTAAAETPEHQEIMDALSRDVPPERRDDDPLYQAALKAG